MLIKCPVLFVSLLFLGTSMWLLVDLHLNCEEVRYSYVHSNHANINMLRVRDFSQVPDISGVGSTCDSVASWPNIVSGPLVPFVFDFFFVI